jgi:hypothetical protein
MNDYQFTYCIKCGATHSKDFHKEESYLSAFSAFIMCLIVIGLVWAILITVGA